MCIEVSVNIKILLSPEKVVLKMFHIQGFNAFIYELLEPGAIIV